MREQDFKDFSALLDGVCSLLSRGAYTPNATNTALFFRALERFDIAAVRAAFSAHVNDPARGKFAPVPADILAQLGVAFAENDGRPGVEEAWAAVPLDEGATVVWTGEMAEAFGLCSALVNAGDRIGARMAFKEVYIRLVAQARQAGKPVRWIASLGSDIEGRKRALAAAVQAGNMTAEIAYEACPLLPAPQSLKLAAPAKNERASAKAKRELTELAATLRGAEPADPLKWAKDLRTKERGGLRITEAQSKAWREAIDRAPSDVMPAAFTPIPDDALPPGMRKHAGGRA